MKLLAITKDNEIITGYVDSLPTPPVREITIDHRIIKIRDTKGVAIQLDEEPNLYYIWNERIYKGTDEVDKKIKLVIDNEMRVKNGN